MVQGLINNFRRGRRTQNPKHMIITVPGINDRKAAEKLLNKKVVWQTPSGKKMEGTIKSLHGNKGAVRAIFKAGLPGQSIGTKIEVI
ncbi:50S ribosomal protein L35ae [Candidatus Woesearchaeota archaeon]|nr:50S ribosomal protein L35ae [Candidatus Woesearchaeota archaeon]